MSMCSRLCLIFVTFILVWGCNQPPSTQPSQVVRRKIVNEPSGSVNTQQKAIVPGTALSSSKLADKEGGPKTMLPSSDPATVLLNKEGATSEYRYQGILDPFLPLIREEKGGPPKDPVADKSEKRKRVPQTPLEKIDLTQLTLTAIFKEKNKIRGLVEESAGKGYIVTNGTFIGLDGGQITKMLEDRIIVTELSTDVMGKPVAIEHELKLRQSSGE